jgi:hypothetical protein
LSWPEDTTFLLVACPACGRDVGEACVSGYSFAVDPHQERREAAHQLNPLICRTCGQLCQEQDFHWSMLGHGDNGSQPHLPPQGDPPGGDRPAGHLRLLHELGRLLSWWRRRKPLSQEEAFSLVVACPKCHAERGVRCSAEMPHAERIAARWERDRTALDWYATLVREVDPLLSAYGYENEARRVDGGWAHWQRVDGSYLAIRLGGTESETWATLAEHSIPEDLRLQLAALGVRSYCPECGSTSHWEPLASCIRD